MQQQRILDENVSRRAEVVKGPKSIYLFKAKSNVRELKETINRLTETRNEINVSVSVDGLSRHGNDLLMGKGMSDGTAHYLFEIWIDVVSEKPFPPHSMTVQEVDTFVIQWMKDHTDVDLAGFRLFLVSSRFQDVKKEGSKTEKIKYVVVTPPQDLSFEVIGNSLFYFVFIFFTSFILFCCVDQIIFVSYFSTNLKNRGRRLR
jgi:hypothetical protein